LGRGQTIHQTTGGEGARFSFFFPVTKRGCLEIPYEWENRRKTLGNLAQIPSEYGFLMGQVMFTRGNSRFETHCTDATHLTLFWKNVGHPPWTGTEKIWSALFVTNLEDLKVQNLFGFLWMKMEAFDS